MAKFDECAICLEMRTLNVLEPCGHAFCDQCLHRLLMRHCHCPQCRRLFVGCAPPLVVHKEQLTLRRKSGEPFGLSFDREADEDQIVVSVSKAGGLANRAGVREGWVLQSINGLPCYDVGCAMQQMQAGDEVTISVRRPLGENAASSLCSRLCGCLRS